MDEDAHVHVGTYSTGIGKLNNNNSPSHSNVDSNQVSFTKSYCKKTEEEHEKSLHIEVGKEEENNAS